jgi:hypothetical protein
MRLAMFRIVIVKSKVRYRYLMLARIELGL